MPSSDEEILAVVQTFGDEVVSGAAQDLAYVLAPALRALDPSLLKDQISTKLATTHKHFRKPTGPAPGTVQAAAATYVQSQGMRPLAPGQILDLAGGMRSAAPSTHADLLGNRTATPQQAPQLTAAQSLELIIKQRLETQQAQTHVIGAIPPGRHMGTAKRGNRR